MLKHLRTLLLLFLISGSCYCQDLKVSYIKIKPDPRLGTKDSAIVYPIFKFDNTKLSKQINLSLKNEFKEFYDIPDSIKDIQGILKEASSQGLVSFEYSLVRNDKRFFSFLIGVEWMAAYPSSHDKYYLYDKSTSHLLTLDSLLAPGKKNAFLNILRQKQKKKILDYKKELLVELKNKDIEEEDYELAMEKVKNDCWNYYNPKQFKVSADKIEIMIDCQFPHFRQNMSPESTLSFSLAFFRQYVKPEYKNL